MTVADLVVIGLAITLEPLPLTGFIVVLASRRGSRNGVAYLVGWVLCLVVVVTGTLLVTDGRPPKPATAPSIAVESIKVAIGAALVAFALYRHRRPRPPSGPPKWLTGVENMGVGGAAGIAVLLQPWVLVAAGASAVAQMAVPSLASILLLVLFCVLATAAPLLMEGYVLLRPQEARARRDGIVVVVAVVVGLWLLGNGISAIVSS